MGNTSSAPQKPGGPEAQADEPAPAQAANRSAPASPETSDTEAERSTEPQEDSDEPPAPTAHLSFAILNDLREVVRHDTDVPHTIAGIRGFLLEVADRYAEGKGEYARDPTGIMLDRTWGEPGPRRTLRDRPAELEDMALELAREGYWVANHVNKYYVLAFAVNYARFEVYSKERDKELIKWRENDRGDRVHHQVSDAEYNENPVLQTIRRELYA